MRIVCLVVLSCYMLVLQMCPSVTDLLRGHGLGFCANNKGRFGDIVADGIALSRFILDVQVSVD